MNSIKVLSMEIQETPLQKTHQISNGSQSFNIDFLGANRQLDWLQISLTSDKSDKHNTVYESYNVEKGATFFNSIVLENISRNLQFNKSNEIQH